MAGFCQFVTGVYLFAALTWFESLKDPVLYTAAVAFSAYGIHWFALGWNRYQRNDPRPNGLMSIPFTVLSALGMEPFFSAGAWPVGVLFLGLTGVYVSDFLASSGWALEDQPQGPRVVSSRPQRPNLPIPSPPILPRRCSGVFRIATGLWLMYLTVATTLDISRTYNLPGG
jgi:hypothetical protein